MPSVNSIGCRLRTLRPQSDAQTRDKPGVSERLQGLRTHSAAASHGGDSEALARLLGGTIAAPDLILVRETLSDDARNPAAASGAMALLDLAGVTPPSDGSAPTIAFLDTETTGLTRGVGTLVFMLGLAIIGRAGCELRQYVLNSPRGEAALLQQAGVLVSACDLLVSYNGSGFDLPVLAASCRMAGVDNRYAPLPQLDLLYEVRRAFGRRWPDCRLRTAERRLLGLHRVDDLPGEEAPAAWLDWLRAGYGQRLRQVLQHNRLDVLSLPELGRRMVDVLAKPQRHAADITRLARHRLSAGDVAGAQALLSAATSALDSEGQRLLADLHRRRGAWTPAVALWHRLAEQGCAHSLLALAKYHEHVHHDPRAALHATEELIRLEGARREHLHRRHRLQRKLGSYGLRQRVAAGRVSC